jgi:hypothetical protein
MTWLQRYRVRHYLGSSIWIFPVLSTLVAIGAVRVLHWIEVDAGWVPPLDPETERPVLGTMASALFTAIVLLHRSAERFFTEPEDRALADVSDFKGVGGSAWYSALGPPQPFQFNEFKKHQFETEE